MFYDGVFVPDDRIVDRVVIGAGARNRPGANGWALPIAAVYLGVGQAALDAACAYAQDPRAPVAGPPDRRAAAHPGLDRGRWRSPCPPPAPCCTRRRAPGWSRRLCAARWGRRSRWRSICVPTRPARWTDKALRVAGGFSLTSALPLERYFRDARAGLFQPAAGRSRRRMIGRAALGAGWRLSD
ncbi:MAG: hypothetical protein WDN49_27835 [Acetobacteraceae bacterium]